LAQILASIGFNTVWTPMSDVLAYFALCLVFGNVLFTITLLNLLHLSTLDSPPALTNVRARGPKRNGTILPITPVELWVCALRRHGWTYVPAFVQYLKGGPRYQEEEPPEHSSLHDNLLSSVINTEIRACEPDSILFGAPSRHPAAASLGISTGILLGAVLVGIYPHEDLPYVCLTSWSITLMLAWCASWCAALKQQAATGVLAHMRLSPHQLLYSQDSIASCFQDGRAITSRLREYSIVACLWTIPCGPEKYTTELFTLNNRTLFSAIYNGVETVKVAIVETDGFQDRFTASRPFTTIRRRRSTRQFAVAIPEALRVPVVRGHAVLEADRIINRRPGQEETLGSMLRERRAHNKFYIQGSIDNEEGPRSYARVRVSINDEDAIRSAIKDIGKERGKRVNVKTISRVFESPRD